MQNHEYHQQNMHGAKFCTKIYANGKKSQVDTAWRSHPPTANSTYQQLSGAARLHAVRTPPAPRPHPPTSA